MITDKFQFSHLSASDMTYAGLVERVALLELDNERLRIDLENSKSELNAKNAANEGLKNKIAELYMEARILFQEKQKLHNSVIDIQNHLVTAENSTKWYQSQIHDLQASKNSLKIEIDTYQIMLEQKYQALLNVTTKWKQLNEDYFTVIQKHRKEKDILQTEIESLKTNNNSIKNRSVLIQPKSLVSISTYTDISNKLDWTEKKLQDVRSKLHTLEQRLINSEMEKISLQSAFDKNEILLSSMEDNMQRCQNENIKLDNIIHKLRIELQKLTTENETQQMNLLSGIQEREQVEDAIQQLRSQLTKMLAQHKLLKNKNIELDGKLNFMQDICNENKRLKSLSYSSNECLLRKLRQEKRKAYKFHQLLCQEQRKQRTLNKDLKEEHKSTKISEENLDEGYADGSVASFQISSLSSPPFLDPKLLNNINDILSESKNFWEPIQIELNKLYTKLEIYKDVKIPRINNFYCNNTPPLSPNSG